MERARELFGPAPQPATFNTAGLEAAHATVTTQLGAVTEAWRGESSRAYRDTASGMAAALGRTVAAHTAASAAMAAAAAVATHRRRLMDGIIADTARGVAAIAPTTETSAGQAQLLRHFRTQLNRARVVIAATSQADSALSAHFRAAADTYRGADAPHSVQAVDFKPQAPPTNGGVQPVDNHRQKCEPYDYAKDSLAFLGGLTAGIAGVLASEVGVGYLGIIGGAIVMGTAGADIIRCPS
jgi:uncharacterized protein YukE